MANPSHSLIPIENAGSVDAIRVELVGEKETCAEIASLLKQIGDPPVDIVTVDHADPSTAATPADMVIVVVDPTTIGHLRTYAGQLPRPTIFAALSERGVLAMRRALQAGADELLFLPLETGALMRALLIINETRLSAHRRTGGTICSVTSNSGGVGVTSVACNLGLALREKLEKRVALVDLHLQAGDLPVYLNLPVQSSIMTLAQFDRQIDSSKLESVLTKHSSGIYVLAAPTGIEESEVLSEETVVAVLGLMRELFDYVVVDCGSYVDEKTVAVWERSDYLFYVLDQTVKAARGATRFQDLFNRLGISQIEPRFILNKYSAAHPIGEDQITQTLGAPIYSRLPADKAALDRVELRGEGLRQVAASSALTRATEDLVLKMIGQEHGEKREHLFSRLFSGVAARAS